MGSPPLKHGSGTQHLQRPNSSTEYPSVFKSLEGVLDGTPSRDSVVLLGDFKAHVGNNSETWKGVIGTNGLLHLNLSSGVVKDFCALYQDQG